MTAESRTTVRHALVGRELTHDEPQCDDCGVTLREADLLTLAADRTDESWTATRCWCAGCGPTRPRAVEEAVLAEGTLGLQSDPRNRRHYPVPVRLTVLNRHPEVPA